MAEYDRTTFSVYAAPTTPSSSHGQINVNFTFYYSEDNVETNSIRLDHYDEWEDDELDDHIVSKMSGFFWPINEDDYYSIVDDVVHKVRLLACDIQVDIRACPSEEEETSDRAVEAVEIDYKSLKRKRKRIEFEEDEEEGNGGCCCVICLGELGEGTEVVKLPCDHYSFHEDCLMTWLAKSPSCPLCRRKMRCVVDSDDKG